MRKCYNCSKPARPGKWACERCAASNRKSTARKLAEYKRKGLCKCGRKREGKHLCGTCHQWQLAYTRLHRLGLGKAETERARIATKKFKGRCEICQRLAKTPCLDHKGRRFRGILCWHCNIALGHVFDSVKILKRAIGYLRRTRTWR